MLITEQIDLIATRSACGFLLLLCDEVFSKKGGENEFWASVLEITELIPLVRMFKEFLRVLLGKIVFQWKPRFYCHHPVSKDDNSLNCLKSASHASSILLKIRSSCDLHLLVANRTLLRQVSSFTCNVDIESSTTKSVAS